MRGIGRRRFVINGTTVARCDANRVTGVGVTAAPSPAKAANGDHRYLSVAGGREASA
jgi:hypothetical protein